jgi:hypothetical protein
MRRQQPLRSVRTVRTRTVVFKLNYQINQYPKKSLIVSLGVNPAPDLVRIQSVTVIIDSKVISGSKVWETYLNMTYIYLFYYIMEEFKKKIKELEEKVKELEMKLTQILNYISI